MDYGSRITGAAASALTDACDQLHCFSMTSCYVSDIGVSALAYGIGLGFK
jgi:hypothetical protein